MYNGVASIASMLAGFGFTSLSMSFPEKTSVIMQVLYLSFTAAAIGFELCAIINASTCSVFGPGKFLRGKGGIAAAEQVVKVLEDKAEITLWYFYVGLFCIVISSAFKAFLLYYFINAVLVTLALVGMTFILL
jgi:hypothetical protein